MKDMEEYKVKQITNQVGFGGKEYIYLVTECGKLMMLETDGETGERIWTVITVPKDN